MPIKLPNLNSKEMHFKTRHRIVLIYLLIQLVLGGLIMYGIFTENSADNGILKGIATYLGLAFVFIFVALLLYKSQNKDEMRQAYLRAFLATILFWLLAWPVTVKIIDTFF